MRFSKRPIAVKDDCLLIAAAFSMRPPSTRSLGDIATDGTNFFKLAISWVEAELHPGELERPIVRAVVV